MEFVVDTSKVREEFKFLYYMVDHLEDDIAQEIACLIRKTEANILRNERQLNDQ